MAPPIAKLARAFGLNGSMLDVRMRGSARARTRASLSRRVTPVCAAQIMNKARDRYHARLAKQKEASQ